MRHTSDEIRNALRVLYNATQDPQEDAPPVCIDEETLRAWTAELEQEMYAGSSIQFSCPCCGEMIALRLYASRESTTDHPSA